MSEKNRCNTYMEEKIKPRTIIPREISCSRVLYMGREDIVLENKKASREMECPGSQIDKEKKEENIARTACHILI